ncbi:MAG: hypothetical protein INQ03_12965 [Candidatus Heimdallarchaeota archaeon]|nr:hypothetical protein [Candidatus Heimdallarchaeota archaeon]
MFTNIRPLNRYGRERNTSAVFIDRARETLVDTITGEERLNWILSTGSILILVKLLSGNLQGLIFTIVCFYGLYLASCVQTVFTFTESRVISIRKFEYPRLVRIFGIIFLVVTFITFFSFFSVITEEIIESRLQILASIFHLLDVLPLLSLQYFNFFTTNFSFIRLFDLSLSILINLWLGLFLLNINYQFKEVNYSQISDSLMKRSTRSSIQRSILLHLLILVLILATGQISLINLFWIFLIQLWLPKHQISVISFYGHSGRAVLPKLYFENYQYHRIVRVCSKLFNWGMNESGENFPLDVIPMDVVSNYETGLRASLGSALNRGNILGMFIGLIINIVVIYRLFNFAYTFNRSTLPTVWGVMFFIIIAIIIFFFFLRLIDKVIIRLQKEESLMIGNGFIGRWRDPNLWIIKGDKLEGKRNKKNTLQDIFSYERTTGFNIAWRTVIFVSTLIIFALFILFWISVGALNVSKAVYVLPFLFGLGLDFLSTKANYELGFFIVSSFVVWILIYYLYPRRYAASRPKLVFSIEHMANLTVIMKNQEDLEDAMKQFSQCIITTSRPDRRKTPGRPGSFLIKAELLNFWSSRERLIQFQIGQNNRYSAVIPMNDVGSDKEVTLLDDIRVSGQSGMPKVSMCTYVKRQEELIQVHEEVFELEQTESIRSIIINPELSITIKFTILGSYS